MTELYFEDYHVGLKFKTNGRTITEADIVNYAYLSGDWFPLHIDAEYARKTIFGERVAHGLLTITIASGLLVNRGLISPHSFIALLGLNNVRFKRPVKIGDTLNVEAEVTSKEEKDETKGIIVIRSTVRNQKEDDVATFDLVALLKKRPTEAQSVGPMSARVAFL
ncbi:MAG: MaoC/PaaZ C-terminal domain-containing protein [Nitrososphaerota archaeon]|nr:MaoC/PaaZ C-terminal domain-containing protein [Nitrososphaerota archaeon]